MGDGAIFMAAYVVARDISKEICTLLILLWKHSQPSMNLAFGKISQTIRKFLK